MRRSRTLPYLPGLDGLRGLAVVAVVLYHAGQTWLPGGFLGVEVFFVISGYIITAGLLAERRENGGVAFRAFWTRRALRLLPGLFAMLAVVLGVSALFAPERFAQVRSDSAVAAVYVTNWKLIFEHTPYFQSFGPPPLLKHLWSLAVEEQFYIVWPVLFAMLTWRFGNGRAALVLTAVALGSAGLMAALYRDQFNTTRIYYGTDTRACGLLLGAALAFVVTPGASRGRLRGAAIALAAIGGVAVLATLFLRVTEYQPLLYRGGFLLTDLATAAVIVAVSNPHGVLSRVLGVLPLRWTGVRSYGIYLWHWPLLLLIEPDTGSPALNLGLRLAAVGGVSALSYALVEVPARHGGIIRLWRAMTAPEATTWGYGRAIGSIGSVLGVVAFAVSVTAIKAPAAGASRSAVIEAPLLFEASPAATWPAVEQALEDFTEASFAPEPEPMAVEAPPEPPPPPPAPPPPLPVVGVVPIPAGLKILAVGDSVMLGASRQMVYLMGSMDLDADVGRQVSNGIDVLRGHVASGGAPDVAIVGLGNNGGFTGRQFDQVMEELADVRLVIFVNVHVPRPWEESNNKVIEQGVAAHPNTVLIDWRSATVDHPEVFGEDKVHLTGSGIRLYAGLIADAIVDNWK